MQSVRGSIYCEQRVCGRGTDVSFQSSIRSRCDEPLSSTAGEGPRTRTETPGLPGGRALPAQLELQLLGAAGALVLGVGRNLQALAGYLDGERLLRLDEIG